jgi:hypothetical protein
MTKDPGCLDMIIDEATKALDRRLEELGKLPECEESRKESVEILHAAKRLLILRAESSESSDRVGATGEAASGRR